MALDSDKKISLKGIGKKAGTVVLSSLCAYGAYNAVGPTYGSTQSVKFTGNTITGNGGYDVAIYNNSDTYSIQTVTSGGGNTIGTIYADGDGTQSVTLP